MKQRAIALLAQSRWRAVLVGLIFLTIHPIYFDAIYFTGDEPHYLLGTDSLLRDGDFDVANNYRAGHYRAYYPLELLPQLDIPITTPHIPTEHGTAFPYTIAPAFKFGGLTGVRIQQAVCAYFGVLLFAGAVQLLTGDGWTATVAALLLAILPPWQAQMSRLYPDAVVVLLLGGVVYLLARYEMQPERPPPFFAGFLIAFALGAMPILYLKYGLLALPFVVHTLFIQKFRLNSGIYAGAVAAIGLMVLNVALNGWEVAIGGNFALSHNFRSAGAFGRYWRFWFDSHHGLFVHAPYTLLVFWPIAVYLRSEQRLLKTVAASVLLFTAMHGFWTRDPGYSLPGRYFASAVPLMCILVAIWAMQKDQWMRLRLSIVAACTVIPICMLALSLYNRRSADYMLRPYWTNWFPSYSRSWHNPDIPTNTRGANVQGLAVVAALTVSKFAAAHRQPN